MRSEPGVNIVTEEGPYQLTPENWVGLHADFLYNYALSRLNDDELARDLVQETFLAALEKSAGFRGESTERTWLTAIMKYKIIDIYRKRAGGLKGTDRLGIPADEPEWFDPDLNHWKKEHWPAPFGVEDKDPLHNKEFMKVLEYCMSKLPPLWISVFRLKHMDDEQTATICKQMRLTSANFWVIIHRAKINLRSCLQKNWI
jgi:RNA polymerase sigma-70 factor (ECF subfamily)